MKLKRLTMLALALAMLAAAGCAGGGSGQSASAMELIDMTGRDVGLDAPAKRVVALTPADLETIAAIGALDCVVGRGEYCDYPPEAAALSVLTSGESINVEQIMALEPDLVAMGNMGLGGRDPLLALEQAGIPVLYTDADTIADVYASIALYGAALGHEAEAASLVKSMKDGFDSIRKEATGKTVYFEASPLEYGLWTAGKDTFPQEIADILGLENIFADVEGWAEVSEEQVIALDPDYIVSLVMYQEGGAAEEIASRPGWKDISAVKNGTIFSAVADELTRPGPRLVSGAVALADFIEGR